MYPARAASRGTRRALGLVLLLLWRWTWSLHCDAAPAAVGVLRSTTNNKNKKQTMMMRCGNAMNRRMRRNTAVDAQVASSRRTTNCQEGGTLSGPPPVAVRHPKAPSRRPRAHPTHAPVMRVGIPLEPTTPSAPSPAPVGGAPGDGSSSTPSLPTPTEMPIPDYFTVSPT